MKQIAIQDANILIDLVNTGLFGYCLALNYQFSTTDLILAELYDEQVELIQPHINAGQFSIITISIDELLEIQNLVAEDAKLSTQDWSAVYFALKKQAILLSGDKRLRILAEQKNIVVCGILWVIDELVKLNLIAVEQACAFLTELMTTNKRLPVLECAQRRKRWCKVD